MYLPLPFVRNRLQNRAVPAAASSTVARFARSALVAALILSFFPDIGLAQDLPGRFQFREKRVFANGTTCTFLSDVTIQGGFVLVAPLNRQCTDGADEFSADEGYLFPLNGKEAHSRDCSLPKGVDPIMTCTGVCRSL